MPSESPHPPEVYGQSLNVRVGERTMSRVEYNAHRQTITTMQHAYASYLVEMRKYADDQSREFHQHTHGLLVGWGLIVGGKMNENFLHLVRVYVTLIEGQAVIPHHASPEPVP